MSTQLDAGKPAKPRRRLPLLAVLFILGLVSLSFVLGAAVMYYRWFTSDSLERAFIGAQAFADRRRALQMLEDASVTQGILDKPGKTYDGFTLYMYGVGTRAYLMNMQGEVVHEWGLPFSQIWPEPTHVAGPVDDSEVLFYVGHLYPNGDLLAILHGPGKPFYGYGLVKLDKDSKVLWKYAGNVHHALAVGDDGVIYALKHELVRQAPAGFKSVRPPFLLDSVVKLSPEGVELKSWPIDLGDLRAARLAELSQGRHVDEGPRARLELFELLDAPEEGAVGQAALLALHPLDDGIGRHDPGRNDAVLALDPPGDLHRAGLEVGHVAAGDLLLLHVLLGDGGG